jgi:hypothetical protein
VVAESLGFTKMWRWEVDSLDWGPGVGPTRGKHLYKSSDQGATWKESTHAPASGLIHFARLGNRSGDWRIADRPDGGFEVQRLAKTWQSVAPFPFGACDR